MDNVQRVPPDNGHEHIHQHFLRNAVGISAVEFCWGLGLPIVVESTFLQLFLRNLGASSFAIGLVPAFFFIGSSVFPMLASLLTSRMTRKRTVVIVLHIIPGAVLFLFGLYYYFSASALPILPVFFVCYAAFSLCIGMILPVWQNFLVKLFTPEKAVTGLSMMFLAQSVARLISSFLILKAVQRYSFSSGASSVIFMVVGVSFALGSLFFFLTRELPDSIKADSAGMPVLHRLGRSLSGILRNRNFVLFIFNDLETFAVIGVISFYANFATEHRGIAPSLASGAFVAFMYGGNILANILLGWFDLLGLKGKFLLSKVLSLTGVALLVGIPVLPSFLAASFLLGAAKSIRGFAFPPAVKRLSGVQDATEYFAAVPLLTVPVSAGISLLSGSFLDSFSALGGGAYRIVFSGMGILILISVFFLYQIHFPPAERAGKQEDEEAASQGSSLAECEGEY